MHCRLVSKPKADLAQIWVDTQDDFILGLSAKPVNVIMVEHIAGANKSSEKPVLGTCSTEGTDNAF